LGTAGGRAAKRPARLLGRTNSRFDNLEGATVLTAPPTDGAYTNDVVEAAYALLADSGVELMGADFAPIDVTLNAGGS